MEPSTMSVRTYLTIKTMERSACGWLVAAEAVASTLLAHPEWDSSDRKTYPEWEEELAKRGTTL